MSVASKSSFVSRGVGYAWSGVDTDALSTPDRGPRAAAWSEQIMSVAIDEWQQDASREQCFLQWDIKSGQLDSTSPLAGHCGARIPALRMWGIAPHPAGGCLDGMRVAIARVSADTLPLPMLPMLPVLPVLPQWRAFVNEVECVNAAACEIECASGTVT